MKKKQAITVEDILTTLAKTKTVRGKRIKWGFTLFVEDLFIRAKIGQSRRCFCPITLYCYIKNGVFFEETRFEKAADIVGIPTKTFNLIIKAADHTTKGKIRKRLLKVTGLLEQAKKNGEKI